MLGGFTLSETREILKKFNIRPIKGLGQNFLVDKNILDKILDTAEIKPEDRVLEIGPGIGTLTRRLASAAQSVVAVELDRRLMPVLEYTLKPCNNVHLINADILNIDLHTLWKDNFKGTFKVVANLPYYITSPVIMRFLEGDLPLDSITVMVQKEVAQRMNARPGTKDYGALSIAVQYRCRVDIVAEVPPTVFVPPPRVSSAIIKLDINGVNKEYNAKDEKLLFQLVKAAFGQRRKTLINALRNNLGNLSRQDLEKALRECSINIRRRGETLSIEEFCCLADYLAEQV